MIRVLIADDHALVRSGIGNFLSVQPDVTVVGMVKDGQAAVAAYATESPDVVLMDLQMPVLDGVEATRRITASDPKARVLVLTSFSDQERIISAIDAGAVGYLLKDAEPEDLLRGIRAAARGESALSPQAASALVTARQHQSSSVMLTTREQEVLARVADGLPNKQIASQLGISEKTVKAHLTSAFQRIGVQDRTQAALWAVRNGLVKEKPTRATQKDYLR